MSWKRLQRVIEVPQWNGGGRVRVRGWGNAESIQISWRHDFALCCKLRQYLQNLPCLAASRRTRYWDSLRDKAELKIWGREPDWVHHLIDVPQSLSHWRAISIRDHQAVIPIVKFVLDSSTFNAQHPISTVHRQTLQSQCFSPPPS
jgi:hypothetical protein